MNIAHNAERQVCLFVFNDAATTEIYTLSLHDALPISGRRSGGPRTAGRRRGRGGGRCPRVRGHGHQRATGTARASRCTARSEEHTSELQSRQYLVCRLLLEKKKKYPSSSVNTSTLPSR